MAVASTWSLFAFETLSLLKAPKVSRCMPRCAAPLTTVYFPLRSRFSFVFVFVFVFSFYFFRSPFFTVVDAVFCLFACFFPPAGVLVLFQALPVDPTVVRNLRSLRKAETSWNFLLDPRRCYRFVYALQVTLGGDGGCGVMW